jgi:transposase-like protein
MTAEADARRALDQIHGDLDRINPSAARSLEEGMEETLTVHKLRMPEMLRKSLASTNVIESAFSVAEELCRRVKRWREGDHRERWGDRLCCWRRASSAASRVIRRSTTAERPNDGIKKGVASAARTA